MPNIKNLYHEVSNKFFGHVNFLMIKCNISSFSNYELGNVSDLSNLSSSVLFSNVISLHSWKYQNYPPNGLIPYFQNLLKEQNWKNQIIWCFFQFCSLLLFSFYKSYTCKQWKQIQAFTSLLFISFTPPPSVCKLFVARTSWKLLTMINNKGDDMQHGNDKQQSDDGKKKSDNEKQL